MMNTQHMAKTRIFDVDGIVSPSDASRKRKWLTCRAHAASVIACTLMLGLPVISVGAEGADQAAPMGENMAGAMNDQGYMPPGLMVGRAGEWMLGYQFMFDKMSGNLMGSHRISNEKILERFAMTPTDMTMQMHMFMAMYAPSDDLTIMAMLPYIRKSMNHVTGMGDSFVERSEGVGDIELRGLYTIYGSADSRHRILLTAGVAFPTGAIDESMGGMRLEYPMQIGSGTFSVLPGVVYTGKATPWSWGTEFGSNVRLGKNSNDYKLGDRYRLSVWGARQLTDSLTMSVRADGEQWGNIRGADPMLDPMDEPTKNATLQGGKRLDLLLGVSLHPKVGILKGQQLFIEGGTPVYQTLDGPQLKRNWVARISWQMPW